MVYAYDGSREIPMIVFIQTTNSEKFAPKNNYVKILDGKNLQYFTI